MLQKALKMNTRGTVPTISFTGGGEPLMYLKSVASLMEFCRSIEEQMDVAPWYYLYTNGVQANLDTVLRLKDLGINEVRLHLGASGFS